MRCLLNDSSYECRDILTSHPIHVSPSIVWRAAKNEIETCSANVRIHIRIHLFSMQMWNDSLSQVAHVQEYANAEPETK